MILNMLFKFHDPVVGFRGKLIIVFFCFVYGGILSSLSFNDLMDRDNYIGYVNHSNQIYEYYRGIGWGGVLTNEPAWLLLNFGLAYFIKDAEYVIGFYIFLSAFITAYTALKFGWRQSIFISIVLFSPQIIKNNIVHLRQGVAISTFLACFLINNLRWRYVLMCVAPFIHASFFFILLLLFMDFFGKKIIKNTWLRLLLIIFACFFVVIFTSSFAEFLGARQAGEYYDVNIEVGGLGFIFWSGVAGLFISQGKEYIEKYFFVFSILIFYLISYFFLPVSARIFESGLLLIILMGIDMNFLRRTTFMVIFTIYSAAGYLINLNYPLLGFGVY